MERMKNHTICFYGQTGFGKSSLINEVFGAHFNTDPLVACTKELYSVTITEKDDTEGIKLITVYDTPGIGEFSSNSIYQAYYDFAASQADHVVLVVTLDRVDTTSQDLLEAIKPHLKKSNVKFTIVINRIDSTGVTDNDHSYKPWDENNNTPTEECWSRIRERFETIKNNYGKETDFLPFDIIPVCALRKYGIKELKERLLKL